MPRRRRKALPAASRSPAIAPRLSAPRRLPRHCGPRAYRRISFRPRRRRRMPAARPIASRFSCCHDDDRDRTILVKPALKIAVAGLGTVGAGTLQLLARQAELLATRAGRRIVVAAVSARDRRRDRGVDLSAARCFEAAVAGGIPVIKTLRESLAGNRLARVYGILNGTSNYILTTMRETGREFAEVLAEAQKLGYAEADPSFDIDGVDAAHKLAILASVAFGRPVDLGGVYAEGIRHISRLDIDFAEELGYRIKLLGIARLTDHGLEQRVHPCMVPRETPIAAVEGVFNAVVADQPGVIADVAAALRDEHVSMESMIQRGRAPGEAVPVVLTTHVTVEAAMQRAIERITALGSVLEPPRMIRIEDF